jgi:hypothetical protein
MELLIAMFLSTLVVSGMVILMANSLGAGRTVIGMARLNQEMRVSMQVMSRDVRRANYSSESILCFGNLDCTTDGTGIVGNDITINASNNCFYFQTDRDHDGDVSNDAYGGYRLRADKGVGAIDMWMADSDDSNRNDEPSCTASTPSRCEVDDDPSWCQLSDPDIIDVTTFVVNNDFGYSDVIDDDGINQTTQNVRKLYLSIEAEMVSDDQITHSIQDVIRVRNDVIVLP